MNANSHYRKDAKCAKCTEAEQHAQTAEAQSRDHAIQSEIAEVAARAANSRAERLALDLRGAGQRAEEFQRRAIEAKKRVGDWGILRFSTLGVERLHYPRSLVQYDNVCECYSSNTSETSSWVKDAQDLQKTIRLVVILFIPYLMGQIMLGWVRHKQRLQQIQAEKDAKCTKCIEAKTQTPELQLRTQIAEVAAREANWRAEQLAVELRGANRRAAKAEERLRDGKLH
ncbi:hypothetical protein N7537_005086 [Penicillium hordei]|uniref:Uncharacterized protein n=1 Tax=Penicillium hordei TaxID=40994 RepID=A0AAD6EDQ7_9EURO|nr:uncharacterized protein N7537_005086 [Penicillium hordei]KAJ5608467.1 hypothetical protein N7537_005086 [Penicillium hordei]